MSCLPEDWGFDSEEMEPDEVPDGPIQLVKVSKNLKKFEVCEEGLQAL